MPTWRSRQDADESWCSLVEIFARKIPKSMLAAMFRVIRFRKTDNSNSNKKNKKKNKANTLPQQTEGVVIQR